jgi:hypothetical protein
MRTPGVGSCGPTAAGAVGAAASAGFVGVDGVGSGSTAGSDSDGARVGVADDALPSPAAAGAASGRVVALAVITGAAIAAALRDSRALADAAAIAASRRASSFAGSENQSVDHTRCSVQPKRRNTSARKRSRSRAVAAR